jgi:CDP-diacylglycerol--glycerol-3-phosphate 3-phosphatidyltransferase
MPRDLEALRRRVQAAILALSEPLLERLVRWGVGPNALTVGGLGLCLVAAAVLIAGAPLWAGILFLAGSALDMFDGALARKTGGGTALGAFLDSSLDRVGEGALFCALVYVFAAQGRPMEAALTALALTGGLLTSYLRARAEALGARCTVGWMSRTERVLLLAAGLILGWPALAVGVIAGFSWWTVAQRLEHVSRRLRGEGAARHGRAG